MKKQLALLFFTLFPSLLFAQSSIYLKRCLDVQSRYTVFKNDSSGQLYLYRASANIGPAINSFDLAKIDPTGNITSQTAFELDSTSFISNLKYVPISSDIIFSAQDETIGASRTSSYLGMMDFSGGVLWSKKYSSSLGIFFSPSFVDVANNTIVSCGYTQNFTLGGNGPIFILITDINGNVLANKAFHCTPSVNNDEFPLEVIKMNNGNYLFINQIALFAADFELAFIEMDSQLNIINSKRLTGVAQNYKVCKRSDGGFYIISSSGFGSFSDITIFNIDSAFSVIWRKQSDNQISSNFGLSISSACVLSNDDLLICGEYSFNDNEQPFLLEVNGAGNITKTKKLNDLSKSFYDQSIVKNNNDGIYLAGAYNDSGAVTASSKGFLLKADLQFNFPCYPDSFQVGLISITSLITPQPITPDTIIINATAAPVSPMLGFVNIPECSSTVGIINNSIHQSLINIYPNPATNNVMIHFGGFKKQPQQLFIYDATGRLVKQENINASQDWLSINVSALQSGVYSMQVKDVSGMVVRKKFVKE